MRPACPPACRARVLPHMACAKPARLPALRVLSYMPCAGPHRCAQTCACCRGADLSAGRVRGISGADIDPLWDWDLQSPLTKALKAAAPSTPSTQGWAYGWAAQQFVRVAAEGMCAAMAAVWRQGKQRALVHALLLLPGSGVASPNERKVCMRVSVCMFVCACRPMRWSQDNGLGREMGCCLLPDTVYPVHVFMCALQAVALVTQRYAREGDGLLPVACRLMLCAPCL